MLSLTNPPFTSHESTDAPDNPLSFPHRPHSAGAHLPSPKFVANASVRLSPFPSPISGDMKSAFSPAPGALGGAFTPYKRPILQRPAKSPVRMYRVWHYYKGDVLNIMYSKVTRYKVVNYRLKEKSVQALKNC